MIGFSSGLASINGIVDTIASVADELHTSEEERRKLDIEQLKLISQVDLAQAEINKVQAQHKSFFIAGARPSIMWICNIGWLLQLIIFPLTEAVLGLFGKTFTAPAMPLEALMTITFATLGIGAYRSYDKMKGTATQRIRETVHSWSDAKIKTEAQKWLR